MVADHPARSMVMAIMAMVASRSEILRTRIGPFGPIGFRGQGVVPLSIVDDSREMAMGLPRESAPLGPSTGRSGPNDCFEKSRDSRVTEFDGCAEGSGY